MVVRLAHEYRGDPEAIRRIPIGVPDSPGSGTAVQIPLGDVADVQLISGPSFIYREHQERYVPIKFSVRGRDLGSAVLEAQSLPDGYRFRLPTDSAMLLKVAEYISNERLCCGFLNFTVVVEPNQGSVWLALTGGEGVKDYIGAVFATSGLLSEDIAREASLR